MVKKLPLIQLILLGGDIILIIASCYLTQVLRFGAFLDISLAFGWPDVLAIIIYLLVFYVFDFYNFYSLDYCNRQESFSVASYAPRFLTALVVADPFVATTSYVFSIRPHANIFLIFNTLLILSFCMAWRHLFHHWKGQIRKALRVLIIGAGQAGSELYQMLTLRSDFQVIGLLDDDPAKWNMRFGDVQVLGGFNRLPALLDQSGVDTVIVATEHHMNRELNKLIFDTKMKGVMVYEMPAFYERILAKIPVQHVSDFWLSYMPISGVLRNTYNLKVRRIFDLTFSLMGLLLTLPLTLLIALAIKIDSPGPIFHIQRRIGLNGRTFDLIKFRSMTVGMEGDRRFAGQKNDPRITRVGRVLRLSRLDEIPQMWNVIHGEMSLIGPRALIEDEVNTFATQIPHFSLRHSIRPGITGWAQINYPHGTTVQNAMAKLEYDLFYIKNLSPLLDLIILARTVMTVLLGRGAR